MAAQGSLIKQTARKLGIAEQTVNLHLFDGSQTGLVRKTQRMRWPAPSVSDLSTRLMSTRLTRYRGKAKVNLVQKTGPLAMTFTLTIRRAALVVALGTIISGCNSSGQNAPPPDLSAAAVEDPLPPPPNESLLPGTRPCRGRSTCGRCAGPRHPPGAPARPALVSDPDFALPEGQGCASAASRFQALVDNDLRTGHTTKDVHSEITSELADIRGRCAQGEDTTDEVVLLRQRFGYPSS